MRIGIVCPYSFVAPGGVQNHVLGLAGWLRRNDHHVEILAPGHPGPGLLESYGLTPDQFTSAGRAVPIRTNGSVARVNFGPRVASRAKHWLDAGDFDAVHLHEPITPSVAVTTLWLTDRPVTATFHANSRIVRSLIALNHLMPGPVQRLDATIAVSNAAARVAKSHYGVHPVVIGNGIEITDYPIAPTQGRWRGGERPRLVFLGRYDEPRKGFQVLTAALPLIRKVHPDLDVVVIGRGSELTIPGVRFVGGVDDATRNQWLASADVYVAPQTGRESFGIVLLEAMACGAPVVASDLDAFAEVLTDAQGPVGHLFTTGSAQDLARAVLASLDEPRDLRLDRGRARAASFDWDRIGPQVIAMYQLAADRRFAEVDGAHGRARRWIA